MPPEKGRAGPTTRTGSQNDTRADEHLRAIVRESTDTTGEPRCRRCRRVLHSPLAVAAGLGPRCGLLAILHVDRRTREAVQDQYELAYPETGAGR